MAAGKAASADRAEFDVLVIGAGAAGLAAAAAVKKNTSEATRIVVLEASPRIGNSWAQRYSRLCLHTPRLTSDLPGLPWPPGTPMYPSKAQVQGYLEAYAQHFKLDVRLRHQVTSVSYDAAKGVYTIDALVWGEGCSGAGQGGSSGELADVTQPVQGGRAVTFTSKAVVLATGPEVVPYEPPLKGRELFKDVAHSCRFKDGSSYKGKKVLVVGFGNSAGEIALDLADHGAQPVLLIRKPKAIVIPKDDGLATQHLRRLDFKKTVRPLIKWIDPLVSAVMHLQMPNLRPYGVPQITPGWFGNEGALHTVGNFDPPHIDVGQVQAIVKGRIKVQQGELRGFTQHGALIAPRTSHKGDSASEFGPEREEPFDAVILCTGYDQAGSFKSLLSPELRSRLLPPGSSTSQATQFPCVSGDQVPGQPGLYILGWDDLCGRLAMIGQEAQHLGKLIAGRLQGTAVQAN